MVWSYLLSDCSNKVCLRGDVDVKLCFVRPFTQVLSYDIQSQRVLITYIHLLLVTKGHMNRHREWRRESERETRQYVVRCVVQTEYPYDHSCLGDKEQTISKHKHRCTYTLSLSLLPFHSQP